MEKIIAERVDRWKKKLIDLGKRNRLISFRPTKVTTVRVVDEQPPEVFATLVTELKAMDFSPMPEGKEKEEGEEPAEEEVEENDKIEMQTQEFKKYDKEKLASKHVDIHLQTNLVKERLAKNLFRIHSSAASVMEEQGYNVLFLAVGFLEWYEAASSDVKIKAPLILIPVELKRASVKGIYKVKYNEEAILLNPALRQKLELEFGISLDDLEDETEKIDLLKVFSDIQKKIESNKRWRVTNDIFLGLFSFAKFMMYKDLEANLKSVLGNEVVQTICGQESHKRESLDSLCSWEELREAVKPQKAFQVLDADSSQQRAIAVVKKGNNLVIEGPPGTGKSQTIANIIAECLSDGKRVLFVSQKMAALEVVKTRLEAVGLGDFCLELHSKKTNKRRVIEELADSLAKPQQPDHKHDQDLLKLENLKEELGAYAREVGAPFGALEMSPYKAMGILASLPEIPDLEYVFKETEQWKEERVLEGYELLVKLSTNTSHINNPNLHPWYGSRLTTDFSYEEKIKVKELMNSVYEANLKLENSGQQLVDASCFKKPDTYKEIEDTLDGTSVLIALPGTAVELLKNSNWDELSVKINDIVADVKRFCAFKEWAQDKFDLSILEEDMVSILEEYKDCVGKFLYFISSSFRKNRRKVKRFKNKKYNPKLEAIVEDLGKICEAKKWAENIDSYSDLGSKIFANLWAARDSEGSELEKFSTWVVKFHKHLTEKHFTEDIFSKVVNKELNIDEISILRENVIKDSIHHRNVLEDLFRAIKFNIIEGLGGELEDFSLESLDKKIAGMAESIENIRPWVAYQDSIKQCQDFGLEDFLMVCEKQDVPKEKLGDTFKCQFFRCWLDTAFSERKSLKKFLGINHDQLIEQFRELDSKQIELAKVRLRHRLSGKVDASWEGASGSERGILTTEARKRRAHKPLRKLFKFIPNILCDLKPCLMMSPLTVAQFLDPTLYKFDLIIFDEASQIPPEDGIGAIIRGEKVVVAGDTKQLPPTSFFQTAVMTPEDDDEDLDEYKPGDLESILDECATSGFPECMLMWHYRSRHEHLIAFSNKHLYGNSLNTFPSSENESDILGINFNYLPDTHYERGKAGANAEEAREVAKAVFEHFRNQPEKSLGVGTFSVRQRFAVEDAIEELRKQDPGLEEFFMEDREEHFFIKNLETIQGDERDVIFISVGYGKNPSGKLPMNFGPLNQLGGERRLNVLVTRARYRVELFSSIRGSDFDLSKTNSEGVHLFKKYLDFAEKGEIVLTQDITEDEEAVADSPFEEAVFDALTRKGIKIKKQVGCSGYKLDLAVVDKENPGEFILGIECDGAAYHSSKTARDRDRLRQQVLEQLGWNIYRIWSTDWFKNPKQELEKALDAVREAQEGGLKKKVSTKLEHKIEYRQPSEKPTKASRQVIPYEITPGKRRLKSDSHYFYNYVQTKQIAEKLEVVVRIEGPIHKEEAIRRVAQFWGFTSTGSRIKERLQGAVSFLRRNKKIKVKGDFYWLKDMEIPRIRDRENLEGINKKITMICPEEIAEASLFVLSKEYGIPESDLIVQTAKVLGYKRVTEDMSKYISKSIKKYKDSGHIIEQRGRVLINPEKPKEETQRIEIIEELQEEDISTTIQTEVKPVGVVFESEFKTEKRIQEAIDKKQAITIEYSSPTQGDSKRTIEPFKLEGVYIRAYCHLAHSNRTFRIDRITNIEE